MSELVIGMLAYVYHAQVEDDLGKNLKEVFAGAYSVDVDKSIAINNIQQEVREIWRQVKTVLKVWERT